MAPRVVRIYTGETNSNIIGFSTSCSAIPEDPRFAKFMQERGYAVIDPAPRPEGAASYRYADTRPPLSSEHLQELGELCVDFVRTFEHGIQIIDNRSTPPALIPESGILIAEC